MVVPLDALVFETDTYFAYVAAGNDRLNGVRSRSPRGVNGASQRRSLRLSPATQLSQRSRCR